MTGGGRLGVELAGYRIDALIGQGGMGVVYRATHVRLGRPAALKLLAAALAADEQYRRRFEREARLAASLEHPHIVPIYDAGYTEGVLYLAMRYVDGVDLGMVIDGEGPMGVDRVCDLLGGVADALDAAHRAGLVHRDVKPANVLVTAAPRPGGPQQAYLCDFGIAKQTATGSALTLTGQFLGTLPYCSPEQIQGQVVDGRADQYALGCVVFHCLTGQVPFPGDELAAVMFAHVFTDPPRASAHRPGLPSKVDAVIARALSKEPTQRFPDCTSFIQALRAAGGAAVVTVRAPQPGLAPPMPTPSTVLVAPNTDPLNKARDALEKRLTDAEKGGGGPGFWALSWVFGLPFGLLFGLAEGLIIGLAQGLLYGLLVGLLAGVFGGLGFGLIMGLIFVLPMRFLAKVDRRVAPMRDEASFRKSLEIALPRWAYNCTIVEDDFLQFRARYTLPSLRDLGRISVHLDRDRNSATLIGPHLAVRRVIRRVTRQ